MKATNQQIKAAAPAFRVLTRAEGIRGRAAYKLARVVNAVQPLITDLQEAQKKVILSHAKKGKDGEPILEERDGVKDCYVWNDEKALVAEMNELLEVENEIAVEPLRVEELEDADVPPQEGEPDLKMWEVFALLGPFVVEE